jgi:hypothetical protein
MCTIASESDVIMRHRDRDPCFPRAKGAGNNLPAQSCSQPVLKGFWVVVLMFTTMLFVWELMDQYAANTWADLAHPSTIAGVPEGTVQYSLRR